MRVYLIALILLALVQSSLLPVNLCLLFIIAKSFAKYGKENYYLGLLAGITLGILTTANLGFWALIFLMVVYTTHLVRKLPITANFLTILPVSFGIILIVTLVESFFLSQKINNWMIIIEPVLTLPLFILIKIWEERFVVRDDIKLKIKS